MARSTDLADALGVAAERSGEIVIAAHELLTALGAPRAGVADDTSAVRLIDTLADTTRQLHAEATELSRRISGARRELGVEGTPPAEAAPPRRRGPEPAVDESATARRLSGDRLEPPSAGVRLLVTQLAAVGATRLEIEERLREDFAIRNARAVVEHVLDAGE
ncbi:MAG: hypothetical protein ACRDK9_00165 [Solirubrobacterales bacterium]